MDLNKYQDVEKLYEHNARIIILEAEMAALKESVKGLTQTLSELSNVLSDIQRSFIILKWILVGMILMALLQNADVVSLLKLLFNKLI